VQLLVYDVWGIIGGLLKVSNPVTLVLWIVQVPAPDEGEDAFEQLRSGKIQ
jgi:hypothetical protein